MRIYFSKRAFASPWPIAVPLLAGCLLLSEQGSPLRILQQDEPRVYFFRSCEFTAANSKVSYDEWEKNFSRLMGIEGKALDEEIPGRSARNIEFFTRFKQRHPDQLVMLHYNGNARDPRDRTERYFAGHWLYYNGARILSGIPAQTGETDVSVNDAALFRTNIGRFRNSNEDVGLCELGADGKPNWAASEQVQLLSVDTVKSTIRVKRAAFGTTPRAFSANHSYAAPHVTEGPWGTEANLLWFYNHSTTCPRDRAGRTCDDILIDEVAAHFAPKGDLAAFDGLEFDLMMHSLSVGRDPTRGADVDADGRADSGWIGEKNLYGAGSVEFLSRLRDKLSRTKLLLADGWSANNQRAFGILNGVEAEGWPSLVDYKIEDWSGGLNRQSFWVKHSRAPAFNYINHKFNIDGEIQRADSPHLHPSTHRLVFAGAIFSGSAICYSLSPRAEDGTLAGVWDELWKGTEHQLGWLGKALSPAVHLAQRQPDLLRGQDLLKHLSGGDVSFTKEGGRVRIAAKDSSALELRFQLTDLAPESSDLFLVVNASAAQTGREPAVAGRTMFAQLAGSKNRRSLSWLTGAEFEYGWYFPDPPAGHAAVEYQVEGGEPIWISVAAYAYPDAMYREFERGVVLANPSPRPYTFDLPNLFPGKSFRRLRGSAMQDTATNSGAAVAGSLTLSPKDAIFLAR